MNYIDGVNKLNDFLMKINIYRYSAINVKYRK